MTPAPPPNSDREVRTVPFDEWADVDTLVHRTGVTSGDFDYVLRPLCPDCGGTLALQYDETDDGESFLAELTCDACQVAWQASDEDEEDE